MGSTGADTTSIILNFLKDNWDEIALLISAIVGCFFAISFLLTKQSALFLLTGFVYFPTLAFIIAKLFFNTTWILLSGYVLGVSLSMSILLWAAELNDDPDNGKLFEKAIGNGFFTALLCLITIL